MKYSFYNIQETIAHVPERLEAAKTRAKDIFQNPRLNKHNHTLEDLTSYELAMETARITNLMISLVTGLEPTSKEYLDLKRKHQEADLPEGF